MDACIFSMRDSLKNNKILFCTYSLISPNYIRIMYLKMREEMFPSSSS